MIRKGTLDDANAVIALRVEAETWLHAAGIQQWVDRARGIRNIRDGLEAGTTYVVENDRSEIVASLTLGGPDFDFWTEDDAPSEALYLYKFMIGRGCRGTGLGDRLLEWACDQAREQGRRWLRLDCWRENTALQRYYLNRGFEHVRTVVVPGRGSGALFQRPVLDVRVQENVHSAACRT